MDYQKLTADFIRSFEAGDSDKIGSLLASDLRSYITNAEGGVKLLQGRDAFIENIDAMNVKVVQPKLNIMQMAQFDENKVMLMVEVKAHNKGKSLHNFAAFLLSFEQGLISEMRMVEAHPSESDAFWTG